MNGTPIQEDGTYNEQVVLTVRGTDLYGSHYGVYRIADGERVEYTPLGGTYDAPEYILQDNGVYEVVANGEVVRKVVLSGIPVDMVGFGTKQVVQSKTDNINNAGNYNFISTDTRCVNYPFTANEEYPFFFVRMYKAASEPGSINELSLGNCNIISRFNGTGFIALILQPVEVDLPITLSSRGVFVMIANYNN